MTEINETVMSTSNVIAALSKFDDSTYDAIIKNITEIRTQRKSENDLKIAELEAQLNALKSQSPKNRNYSQIANPNNPAEVYRTGKYPDWLKEMAQSEGVDISNKSAMITWVKDKSSH